MQKDERGLTSSEAMEQLRQQQFPDWRPYEAGLGYRPVPDWASRENKRIHAINEYRRTPWHDLTLFCDSRWYYLHFAHTANGDPSQIAFTQSQAHGEVDRQTRMRPGRYLTRYFSDVLTEDEIRHWAQYWIEGTSDLKLHLATDADDIEWVYRTGPNSCMSKHLGAYSSDQHPVRAYASPDFAVAYVTRNNHPRGEVVARCVVSPPRMIYGRMYGNKNRLRPAMEAAGYKGAMYADAWFDLRLARIPQPGGFLCPYLDCGGCVYDDGEWLVISDDGLNACSTDGLVYIARQVTCNDCEEDFDELNATIIAGECICPSCRDNHYVVCEHSGDYVHHDDAIWTADGHCVAERWMGCLYFCSETEEYYYRRFNVYETEDGYVSRVYARDNDWVRRGDYWYPPGDEDDDEVEEAAESAVAPTPASAEFSLNSIPVDRKSLDHQSGWLKHYGTGLYVHPNYIPRGMVGVPLHMCYDDATDLWGHTWYTGARVFCTPEIADQFRARFRELGGNIHNRNVLTQEEIDEALRDPSGSLDASVDHLMDLPAGMERANDWDHIPMAERHSINDRAHHSHHVFCWPLQSWVPARYLPSGLEVVPVGLSARHRDLSEAHCWHDYSRHAGERTLARPEIVRQFLAREAQQQAA